MKNKFVIHLTLVIFIALLSFSFVEIANRNKPYNQLSKLEQLSFRETLIGKLKRDSVFILYDRISKIQTEHLTDIYYSKIQDQRKFISPSRTKMLADLKNNYKNFGIKNSDEYAKLTLVKFALLANISKRYPEFNTMDEKSKVEVFKSSKNPISSEEKTRRIDIAKKAFQRNNQLLLEPKIK